MKQFLAVLALLVVSACSNDAQPLTPTDTVVPPASVTSTGAVSTPADHKGPDHFDPPPLRGFDAKKWHDLTYKSPKYNFGRALVLLPVSEESLQQVCEQQNLTYLGNGRVRFPDGTVVDAIL